MPIIGAVVDRAFRLRKKIVTQRLEPLEYQQKTLKGLLKKSSNTAFGQYYDFKQILKSKDIMDSFRSTVPIFDYNKIYNEWWQRSLEQKANICWPGKIKYFALSSGTSGAPSKYIPVTPDMIRSIRRAGLRMLMTLPNYDVDHSIYETGMMMLGGSTDLKDKGGFEVGDLSGINAGNLPLWLRRFYKPGTEISKLQDWNERLGEIAKNAPNWNIGFVMGIPAWVQLMIEKILEYHNADHIHQIWPNFRIYVTGGVAFEPYRNGFSKLLGKPVEFLDTYLASEGFIAFQTRPATNAMAIQLDNGIFVEFIPFNDDNFTSEGELKPNPTALTIDQVVENQDYALLISTCAGAWRYLIGDTVKFTDLERNEIIITGRTKHFLSICGEHLSVDNMNNAVQLVEAELGVNIREFTVSGIEHNSFFAHKWYIGCEPLVDATLVKERLDEYLKQLNDDYATERKTVLGMEVVPIPIDIFYKWHEKIGKMGGQSKFPRVMRKAQFEKWENFVASQRQEILNK